jgi:hypothetical protein
MIVIVFKIELSVALYQLSKLIHLLISISIDLSINIKISINDDTSISIKLGRILISN